VSASNFPEDCTSDRLQHQPSEYRVYARVLGERGNNRGPARPTSGGFAARKSPMWTGSWLAYGEILRTSAIGAARFLHKAMRPHVVRIATTGKDVTIEIEIMDRGATIEIMDQGLMTGTTGRGLTTVQGLIITTNKVEDRLPRRDSTFSAQWVRFEINEAAELRRPILH
jgi:hypothetical protein